jgi:hypothetical protein
MTSPYDPEDLLAIRELLRQFWRCAQQLRVEWRLALLLNLPSVSDPRRVEPKEDPLDDEPPARPRTSGRSTDRGEIEVLVAHGIASIAEIGQVAELTADHYRLLFAELGIANAEPSFYVVWDSLPLSDKAIGVMLGKTGAQILALRKLAIRQVAACMKAASGPIRHIEVRRSSATGGALR